MLLLPLVLAGPLVQIQPTYVHTVGYLITSLNCLVPRSMYTVWEPDQATACMVALVVQLPCPLSHSPTLPGPLPPSSHPPPLLPHTHSYIPCCLLCRLWLVSCCLGWAILLQDAWGKERFQAVHGDLPELLLKLLISAPKEYITGGNNKPSSKRMVSSCRQFKTRNCRATHVCICYESKHEET